jgi:translation elongation factor EF-Ts
VTIRVTAAMEDTQPLTIAEEEEEQVKYIGENLQVRRFMQEQRKFYQLTRKNNATGEFTGITLDGKQFEKLCFISNYLIAKLADVDKRGEKYKHRLTWEKI